MVVTRGQNKVAEIRGKTEMGVDRVCRGDAVPLCIDLAPQCQTRGAAPVARAKPKTAIGSR